VTISANKTSLQNTVVVGVGSAHGDDQVGWRVVETLLALSMLPSHIVVQRAEPTELLTLFQRMPAVNFIVVDALCSGDVLGSVRELSIDACVSESRFCSTHGVDLAAALRLAQQLEIIPRQLRVIGVVGADFSRGAALSPAVLAAVPAVIDLIMTQCGEG